MNPAASLISRQLRFVVRGPIVLLVALSTWLAPGLSPTRAQEAGCCAPGGPAEAIGHLPRTVELVVVVDDAARTRRSPAATALVGALGELGFSLQELAPQWAKLAADLDWGSQETFDRILGSRVMLVVRDVEKPGARRWAILSEVSEQTEQRLKARLAVAPRKIVAGHPIFALEAGRYELTSHRHEKPANAAAGTPQLCTVTLVLGPAAQPDLFDELVGVLARGGAAPDPLAAAEVVKKAAGLEPADLLVAVRIDPDAVDAQAAPRADRPGLRPWDNFAVAGVRVTDDGCQAKLVVRDHELHADLAAVTPMSDACLKPLAANSLFAVVESRVGDGAPGEEGGNPLDQLLARLALPRDVSGLLTRRQALVITQAPALPPPAAPAAVAAKAVPEAPGQPAVALVAVPAPPDARAIRVTLALETTDVNTLAPPGDTYIAQLVRRIEEHFGDASQPAPCFNGVACSAVRRLPMQLGPENPFASILGSPLVIAWAYSDAAQVNAKSEDSKAVHGKELPSQGWWVMSLGAGAMGTAAVGGGASGNGAGGSREHGSVDSVLRVSRALAETDGGDVRPWLSIGAARPSRWLSTTGASMPALATIFKALSRVDSLDWGLWVDAQRDIEGTIRCRLGPAVPPAVAPVVPAPATGR